MFKRPPVISYRHFHPSLLHIPGTPASDQSSGRDGAFCILDPAAVLQIVIANSYPFRSGLNRCFKL